MNAWQEGAGVGGQEQGIKVGTELPEEQLSPTLGFPVAWVFWVFDSLIQYILHTLTYYL
jgi:hypothetical protein